MSIDIQPAIPETLPISLDQYRLLVDQGAFDRQTGQIELIHGRIVRMNPQGPIHSDPVDELAEWSHEVASSHFRIRIEKPIELLGFSSSPEPDVAWVTRRRYSDRHPTADDIALLIEVSVSSKPFDRGEKRQLYAEAGVREYWIVDVVDQTVEKLTMPTATGFQQVRKFSMTESIAANCLPDAAFAISRLFSDSLL